MSRSTRRSAPRRSWRAFTQRDGREIDLQIHQGLAPHCPCCDGILEAEAESRLVGRLPLGAYGFDLCCRGCRRFWCVVQHTERSLRLLRMRRLAEAVRVAGVRPPSRSRRQAVLASIAA